MDPQELYTELVRVVSGFLLCGAETKAWGGQNRAYVLGASSYMGTCGGQLRGQGVGHGEQLLLSPCSCMFVYSNILRIVKSRSQKSVGMYLIGHK